MENTMRLTRYATLPGLLLLLSSCGRLRDPFIESQVRDRTDYSVIQDKSTNCVIVCGTGSPQITSVCAQGCTLAASGTQRFLFRAGENAMRNIEVSHVPLKSG
ncbi:MULTISPECIES: hypothetical protein [unclassified Paraburkholderia]|uniref:hypothetical protein n=1 Tax=unclassified Paraburkholderia TaxID=2615204 RepID=UPI00160984E9|nr:MULTISPECIES: hypothetical protein [unclassified Paraburkholderia]MBB5411354.1 hypothetical protein [Paraburkholderia sp. HC6.4b]MBB5449889.1 hypothetical protein [Paraburkholderia sp. Kb1A]MBC8724799.1 hypothetical protein [Paraburkholderia sp. 31.1]